MGFPKLTLNDLCPQCDSVVDMQSWEWNRCTCCGYPEVIEDDLDEDDEESCDGIQEWLDDDE